MVYSRGIEGKPGLRPVFGVAVASLPAALGRGSIVGWDEGQAAVVLKSELYHSKGLEAPEASTSLFCCHSLLNDEENVKND